MSAHAYHERLPGYNPAQLLVDECPECEARSLQDTHGIDRLNTGNFKRAWTRAAEWRQRGEGNIAAAEAPMLNVLWVVQVQLQRRGIPIGMIPTGPILPQIAGDAWGSIIDGALAEFDAHEAGE